MLAAVGAICAFPRAFKGGQGKSEGGEAVGEVQQGGGAERLHEKTQGKG